MTAKPFLVTLPLGSPLWDSKDSWVVFAETSAIAIDIASSQSPNNIATLFDAATVTDLSAATDLTGWKLKVVLTSPAGIDKANVTVGASDGVVQATKDFTVSSITALDTQTVTINGQVYTFKTTLTAPTTANEVHIGADATSAALNLFHAINASGGVSGTDYGSLTVANTGVIASNPSAGVVRVTAIAVGDAGNAVAISETCTNGAWAGGATTLSGGLGGATVDGLGSAMAAALALITATAHASYTDSTNVLIVAAGASDALGDHKLQVKMIPPSDAGGSVSIPSFVGTIVDGGVSSDNVTVVLVASAIPGNVVKLRSANRGG